MDPGEQPEPLPPRRELEPLDDAGPVAVYQMTFAVRDEAPLGPTDLAIYNQGVLDSGSNDIPASAVDTTVTIVPEPSVAALTALGLVGVAWGRRGRASG